MTPHNSYDLVGQRCIKLRITCCHFSRKMMSLKEESKTENGENLMKFQTWHGCRFVVNVVPSDGIVGPCRHGTSNLKSKERNLLFIVNVAGPIS